MEPDKCHGRLTPPGAQIALMEVQKTVPAANRHFKQPGIRFQYIPAPVVCRPGIRLEAVDVAIWKGIAKFKGVGAVVGANLQNDRRVGLNKIYNLLEIMFLFRLKMSCSIPLNIARNFKSLSKFIHMQFQAEFI